MTVTDRAATGVREQDLAVIMDVYRPEPGAAEMLLVKPPDSLLPRLSDESVRTEVESPLG